MRITIVDSVSPISNIDTPQLGPLTIYNILKDKYNVTYISLSSISVSKCSEMSKTLEDNVPFFASTILDSTPDVVSFYCLCDSFISALLIAEFLKNKNRRIKILFAGPHVSHFCLQALRSFPFIDIISYGEGEITSRELFSALEAEASLDKVKGIAFRSSEGKIRFNPANRLITEDELCANVLLDYEPYPVMGKDTIYLEAGEDALTNVILLYQCFLGKKSRMKPAKHLVEEMLNLSNKYGISTFSLQHDLFTLNRISVEEFCEELLNSELNLQWYCSARVDCLDNVIIEHMKNAGCKMIFLGIESGSQHVQKVINKNINVDEITKCIDMISASGIGVAVSFIYGLPGETVEDFLRTSELITLLLKRNVFAVNANAYITLPGTAFYDKYRESFVFSPEKLSTSLYRKCSFGEKAINYITSYPECFQCYYTFPSEVMDRYTHFDLLVAAFTQCRDIFRGVLRYFQDNYSLHELYERFKASIDMLYNDLNNNSQFGSGLSDKQLFYRYIKEMIAGELLDGNVHESNHRCLLEISDFENRLCEISPLSKYESLKYNMDVINYRNTGVIRWEETIIEVRVVDSKIILKSKRVISISVP